MFIPQRILAILVTLAAPAVPAAIDLPLATLPAPLADIVITGDNHTGDPAAIVLRADDAPGLDYAHRVDAERMVAPGKFSLRLRLASLTTPRGRPLDPAKLILVRAFTSQPGITFATIRTEPPAPLPPQTRAWFFGPKAEIPLAGMAAVATTDPAVSGPAVREIHRASADPVMAWGMRLTGFEADLPPGRWHFTLWTEDPGEWETLPPVFSRRIRINGADIVLQNSGAADWVRSRYLAGRTQEAAPNLSPYDTLAAPRGGRISADVTLANGHFVLELAGDPPAATHLSLITASPITQAGPGPREDAAGNAVDAVRRARFGETWPVLRPAPTIAPVARLTLTGDTTATTAPGGLVIYRLTAQAPTAISATTAVQSGAITIDLVWGMWRWQRPAPDVAGLIFSAQHLRGDSANIPLRPDLPRPITLVAHVPSATPPGQYHVGFTLRAGSAVQQRDLVLTVLPVSRPTPSQTVGPFLDFAPHLAATLTDGSGAGRRQAACDMGFLAAIGLTAVAPPLTTPSEDPAGFIADLGAAEKVFAAPPIAYAQARRMAWALGTTPAAAAVARADQAARLAGLAPPVWTVADEPSAAGTMDDAIALASAIRLANRDAHLAGHLNDPADTRILQYLDVATVNPRFGADPAMIANLRARGITPFLYNMPNQRLAAGAYLWRSGAAGLLQWHARMPTADAFDPTDGREGDVQFFWPTNDVCGKPDIDESLLALAEGEEDLRWFAWLDAQAEAGQPRAIALRAALQSSVGDTWAAAARLPANAPAAMRAAIIALARGLNR